MDHDTVLHLKALGVTDLSCNKCLSEEFKCFMVFNNQVLCCDQCSEHLKGEKKCTIDSSSTAFLLSSAY